MDGLRNVSPATVTAGSSSVRRSRVRSFSYAAFVSQFSGGQLPSSQLTFFFPVWLKETYAPVLLLRQALALKKEMGLPPDSDKVQTVFEIQGGRKDLKHVLSHGLIRPFRMFAKEPIIQLFSACASFFFLNSVLSTDNPAEQTWPSSTVCTLPSSHA